MKAALNVYKRLGETPLQTLQRLQEANPRLRHEVLTYAGRLDPLAEGVLVVLVGDEAKRKDLYLSLRKTYQVEVLFGWSTDTYDVAGKLTDTSGGRPAMVALMEAIAKLEGTFSQAYPPYSSKPVRGKPLFAWAREGRLHEIELPVHEVTIYRALLRHCETVSGEAIARHVEESLPLLKGDFRQEELYACWQENLKGRYGQLYDLATLEVECSSGTYMRALAHDLGAALGLPALAFRIVRTQVGMYTLAESLRDAAVAESLPPEEPIHDTQK